MGVDSRGDLKTVRPLGGRATLFPGRRATRVE